jgi:RNA polymerase sigma-70 factor (ECF subfamily)
VSTSPEEVSWVVRAQCDDREALELLLRRIHAPLQRYVGRLVGPVGTDDVVQIVLITAARKLKWLTEPRLFRAWTFRIATRAAFAYLRREKRRHTEDADEAALETLAAPAVKPPDELLRELLDSDVLSPASRAVLVLHFEEEMPLAEVAAVLGLPLGTVKSRLAYGLKALRRYLGDSRRI